MVDSRHFEIHKVAISQQRFYRSPATMTTAPVNFTMPDHA